MIFEINAELNCTYTLTLLTQHEGSASIWGFESIKDAKDMVKVIVDTATPEELIRKIEPLALQGRMRMNSKFATRGL